MNQHSNMSSNSEPSSQTTRDQEIVVPQSRQQYQHREDEIAVTFEYEPPSPVPHRGLHHPRRNGFRSNERRTRSNRYRISHNYNHRHLQAIINHNQHLHHHPHQRNARTHERRVENSCRYYTKHWVFRFTAAVLTGTVFMVIGIALACIDVAAYIGIMFMLVSFPSIFMAIHMIRTQMRRRRLTRLQIMRERRRATRRRRQAAEDAAYRAVSLPYAVDLPPSYENIGFNDEGELPVEVDPDNISLYSSSDDSIAPPPSYDDEWEKESTYKKEDCEVFEGNEINSTKIARKTSPPSVVKSDAIQSRQGSQNPHCSYSSQL